MGFLAPTAASLSSSVTRRLNWGLFAPLSVRALGRSRGGFSTKIHVRCDGNGRPLVFYLTGGEAADYQALPHLLDGWRVHRSGPGWPRQRPLRLAADRSYSNRPVRHDLRRRGIGSVIPQPKGQRPCALIDWQACAQRNQVERLVGCLKQRRRNDSRYERRVANYLAMLPIDAIMRWLQA
ncbi:IS5 family transposase [Geminicoccus harenae]|uniref:IS5 family transposase n=1 Tax=Geminicoccus harenae TaxID=2498453 RepID=UPI00168B71D7|nr:IS5 family transposase [Geminicoccus harenae]